jgi:spore coat polysaccharide biosynthesis protein SpsF (cytidylyltransferase family)
MSGSHGRLSVSSNNTLVVIQARENSRRLPGKIHMSIGRRTMLEHVIHRARQIGPEVFVATPPPDLDENNVLGRFWKVAGLHPDVQHFVRLTGDCPLLDIGIAQRILAEHLASGNDFTGTSYELDGLDVECFTREALEMAAVHDHDTREHVTPWMRAACKRVKVVDLGGLVTRWSVNTQEDLLWVRDVMFACLRCYEGIPHHTNARASIGGNDGRWPVWDLHAMPAGDLAECAAHDIRKERMTL